jgi:glycosyltransferase involved in cell wall biosynthesis
MTSLPPSSLPPSPLPPSGSSTPVPRVSIGVPVYNGERYLADTLDQLLAQTFTDLEVVVSDNASTDATAAILDAYAARDPRVRVIHQPRNLGAAPNYNEVFRLARAPLFAWHAHDDGVAPGWLAALVAALDARPDAVLAHPWATVVDDDGAFIRDFDDVLGADRPTPHARLGNVVRHLDRDVLAVFGLIRRDALARTGLIRPYQASDLSLLYDLAVLGPFVEVPERLFVKRRHAGRSTAANRKRGDMARWFDTTNRSGVRLLGWKLYRVQVAWIARCPDFTPMSRVRCVIVFSVTFPRTWASKTYRALRRRRHDRRRRDAVVTSSEGTTHP